MAIKIPDRLTFRRRDVVRLTRLDGKVIDYWEREFNALHPVQTETGEKHYTRRDVELILRIKRFLVEQKLNKDEVRKRLKSETSQPGTAAKRPGDAALDSETLKRLRSGLEDILTLLDKHDKK